MDVKTDLSLLGQRVHLPPNASEARWVVLPVVAPGGTGIGPTDTDLYAWVVFSNGRADLNGLAPEPKAPRVGVPTAVAEAILPESVRAHLDLDPKGWYWVQGEALETATLDRGIYRPVYLVWMEQGLLIRWRSR